MIEVKTYENGGDYFKHYEVICPECRVIEKAHCIIYGNCSFCNADWPPIEKMLESVNYRKSYHKGEI
jgi:hypothetical protein